MKRIIITFFLLFTLVSASVYASSATQSSSWVMCTMEAKLCSDGVTYVGRTGPNCEFEACPATSTPPVQACTMDAMICPDWVTSVGRTWPNCEFEACPVTKVCTREYKPVCWQPKMPDCMAGMACPMMMPIATTYANKCVMESEKATFLYEGKCTWEVIFQNQYKISDKLKARIDIQIDILIDLIDGKGLDSTEKTILINKIIAKLNGKSSENPKVKQAVFYIIERLEGYSAASQNQNLWKLPD